MWWKSEELYSLFLQHLVQNFVVTVLKELITLFSLLPPTRSVRFINIFPTSSLLTPSSSVKTTLTISLNPRSSAQLHSSPPYRAPHPHLFIPQKLSSISPNEANHPKHMRVAGMGATQILSYWKLLFCVFKTQQLGFPVLFLIPPFI